MKTFSLKPKEVQRSWYLLDATEAPLGRLSTVAAKLLLGKDKPSFTPHVDGGDFVIVINSDRLIVTGNKNKTKEYFRHSGFPGGLYKRTLEEQKEINSEKIIRHAVRGMLPDNKLRKGRLKRLKVYKTEQHPHSAQKPLIHRFKEGKEV